MLYNDSLILASAILVICLDTFTFYNNNIFPTVDIFSNIIYNDLVQNGLLINNIASHTQELAGTIDLTDDEIIELLEVINLEVGPTNLISYEYLQGLGLFSDSVISLLEAIGYIII
uniref:Uncharacterized protein n=1 Tax=Thelephora ganbajun TaxID=370292 RepID=A0A343B765_THEGA|nr:hypothetical protein [Thelephora ganbajun]